MCNGLNMVSALKLSKEILHSSALYIRKTFINITVLLTDSNNFIMAIRGCEGSNRENHTVNQL